jgi:hypothetical protein
MVPPLIVARNPVASAAIAAGAVATVSGLIFTLLRRRPSKEEIEALRRDHLVSIGRLVDGTLVDANPTFTDPMVVIYQYRIAGVTYECSQDVSTLAGRIHDLDLDLPIQVRYDRANPGDSIVIAESWSGLWSMDPVKSVVKR